MSIEHPIVEFRSVVKSYGSLTVLNHFDFSVRKNEKVSLIGPSGSGKTTVLRVLMTLEPINDGMILVDGQPLTHMEKNGIMQPANEKYVRSIRNKIGMVFQHFNLFPHMTALENCIEAPIQVLKMDKNKAREQAMELLRMVGLAGKENQYPNKLSGGQKQRVAIARALAMKPSILLLDEITSALDPEVICEVLSTVRKMCDDYNLTIIMVTHQMGFAKEFSDRVCFFHSGNIAESGTPSEIFNNPKEPRTQQFLHAVLDSN